MSLEKASIVWNAKQLKGMILNGKINFDYIVQRSYVWERSRKSGLIESMILGYPIPPVFAKRLTGDSAKRGDNTYYIMDGKQRLSTVKEFLNDEFALSDLPPVKYYDDETDTECEADLSGKTFSELPEALKSLLLTIPFNVTYFDNLTSDEERELFKRLNAGKPLSAKSRLLASCKDLNSILDIGSHALFKEMLTDKAKESKNQAAIVMKAWCMLNKKIEDVSFESKIFNPLLETVKISDDEKMILREVFDKLKLVHDLLVERGDKKVARKLYTETHLISLIPFVYRSIGAEDEILADWIADFYSGKTSASKSVLYNNACGGGSAKHANIQDRHDALEASWQDFFKTDGEDKDVQVGAPPDEE